MKSRIAPSTAARAGLALAVAVFACLAATPPAQSYYDEFGCGMYGTDLYPGEHCPVGPKRHSWSEVTAYRNNGRGQNRMCEAVYRDHNGAQLSRRCSYEATSISALPGELQNGRYLSKSYNVHDSQYVGTVERRYLYSRTP